MNRPPVQCQRALLSGLPRCAQLHYGSRRIADQTGARVRADVRARSLRRSASVAAGIRAGSESREASSTPTTFPLDSSGPPGRRG